MNLSNTSYHLDHAEVQKKKKDNFVTNPPFSRILVVQLFEFNSLESACFVNLDRASMFSDGNGFKTSTMRLGADVIVFSRATDARYCLFLFLCNMFFSLDVDYRFAENFSVALLFTVCRISSV